MELTKVQFITWGIRYTATLLFIISFNTTNWFDYNGKEYSHYGLWQTCKGGSTDCDKIDFDSEHLYTGAVVPRILMIVAISLIGVSFAIALLASRRLYKNTKFVVVLFSAMIEFFGALVLGIAFIVAYIYGPEVETAGDKRSADVGFSAIFTMLSGILLLISSIFSMVCFYLQRQKIREDVIVVDGSGRATEMKRVLSVETVASKHSRKRTRNPNYDYN